MQFGLQRKIPGAIRLAEQVLSDQGGKVPRDLQSAFKAYLLVEANQKGYREAMAKGGPKTNTTQIYHDSKNASPIFTLDDPYWQEFMARNSK